MLEICFFGLLIPLCITFYINIFSNKYNSIDNKEGVSGFEVANRILDNNEINKLYIVEGRNISYNIFTGSEKSIKFSKNIFHGESLSSLAFAAIESIHIVQFYEKNNLIKFRNDLMKTIEIICYVSYFILIYGLLVRANNLILFSLGMFILVLIFHLFTYSVERDAKEKALKELLKLKLIDNSEKEDVEKLLNVYSLNYFASIITVLKKIMNLF